MERRVKLPLMRMSRNLLTAVVNAISSADIGCSGGGIRFPYGN